MAGLCGAVSLDGGIGGVPLCAQGNCAGLQDGFSGYDPLNQL
jgi:hypothetical protein